ncbi:hypothetical protein LTR40_004584 [Exophiala xenobiotica]|nr:hypothetical protein LTR40_004584 [Exophiala xenobiotica]
MSPDQTMACKKLLIFGATGLIGKYITQAIVENKDKFDRIAIFTSQGTVQSKADQIDALKKQGVDVIVGDVTNSEDVVKAYQVHRFFPSEYGTDIEYGPASANETPHQKKLKVRAALREECDNLDHTYVVTGPYSDLFLGNNERFKQAGTFDVKNKEAVLVGDENTKISFTTMRDVGKLVVHAALHPEASRNKALRVNSFTATNKEILEAFEKKTGGQSWKVSYTSIEDVKKMEQEALEAGNPFATLFTLRRIWAEGGTLYEKRDNYLIDAEDDMDSLEDAVSEAVKAQTG